MLSFDTPSLNFDTREPEMPKMKIPKRQFSKLPTFQKLPSQIRAWRGEKEAITIFPETISFPRRG